MKPIELSDHSSEAAARPHLYTGNIELADGTLISVQKAAESIECGPILSRYGRWVITEFGIEFLGMYYPIEGARVWENDWLDHLKGKTWFSADDKQDFVDILSEAQKRWPKKD